KLPRVRIALPATQSLTRLTGEQIRDWEIKAAADVIAGQGDGTRVLEVQFIKPVEKSYELTLFSEQTVETTPAAASLSPPQPLELARESGTFTLSTEDTVAEVESAPGLRQVNPPAG